MVGGLSHAWRYVATTLFLVSAMPLSNGDQRVHASAPAAASAPSAVVAATVNGAPIFAKEVAQRVEVAQKRHSGSTENRAKLEAEALRELIDQRLVDVRLAHMGQHVTDADVDKAVAELKAKLKPRNRSLADVLTAAGVDQAALRQQLGRSLRWQKFLDSYLTDQRLEAYFRSHARDYDGSEIRVSHISLRPQESGGKQDAAPLVRQAAALRKQIVSGKIDFAAAAKKYSSGPSRHQGGDLGFIPRHGLMVEDFAQAAFALKEKSAVSDPVVTQFGVHLIRLTDVKPGRKKWTDVRRDLTRDLEQQIVERLAAAERGTAKIEITGATPYFKPGTQELVLPPSVARPGPQR